MGVRVALGAGRWRLARQLLTENILLSTAGAALGLAMAYFASRWLANFILLQTFIVATELNLRPDGRILGFTTAMAILTGVLFGLAPAWRATREDPNMALQRGTPTICGTGRFGKLLFVTQVALSLVLLAGAGLFVRSQSQTKWIHN
jgi:predicted lysophospholipase L1 biosynthesis ABC-type transport system permease subunit